MSVRRLALALIVYGPVLVAQSAGGSAGALETAAALAPFQMPTPAKIVSSLNAQRKANGIPAGIVRDSTLTSDCKKHDLYMKRNHVLTHAEDPSKPGYTAGGNYAGTHGVVASGSNWAGGNVFETAPIHLIQLLQPLMNRMGAFEIDTSPYGGWVCATTFARYRRPVPSTNRIYTYPGPARTRVPYAENARELPFTPNDVLGIPHLTGPQLLVYMEGPAVGGPRDASAYSTKIVSKSVRPLGGSRVSVRSVDGQTPIPASLGGGTMGGYMMVGAGILIPVKPLKPGTTYATSVTMRSGGRSVTKSWRFTTEPVRPTARLLSFGSPIKRSNGSYIVPLHTRWPLTEKRLKELPSTSSGPLSGWLGPFPPYAAFPLPKPPAGGWVKIVVQVPSFNYLGHHYAAVTISKKISA